VKGRSTNGALARVTAGESSFAAYDSSTGDLERCVQEVRNATQSYIEPFRYEYARFDDKPAFFLVFRTSERYELWVMSADATKPCETLFFSQTS